MLTKTTNYNLWHLLLLFVVHQLIKSGSHIWNKMGLASSCRTSTELWGKNCLHTTENLNQTTTNIFLCYTTVFLLIFCPLMVFLIFLDICSPQLATGLTKQTLNVLSEHGRREYSMTMRSLFTNYCLLLQSSCSKSSSSTASHTQEKPKVYNGTGKKLTDISLSLKSKITTFVFILVWLLLTTWAFHSPRAKLAYASAYH